MIQWMKPVARNFAIKHHTGGIMTSEKIKVLVVDDEEGIVDFAQKMLVLKGYNAFGAKDSDKALEIFKKENPEICLLDVHLTYSPLDGVEILEEIKKINPKTECIMVSRITDEEKINKAKKLGALDYLLKPVDANDLVAAVNKVAGRIRVGRPK